MKLIFSNPFETDFQTFTADQKGEYSLVVSDFEGKKTSVFGQVSKFNSTLNLNLDFFETESLKNEKANYFLNANKIIEKLKNGELEKVVLSRRSFIETKSTVDQLLNGLRKKFKNAFVYLLQSKKSVWIGATPEVLLNANGNRAKTFSLAGTKLLNEKFTEKEEHEQQLVTDFICSTLKRNGAKPKVNPRFESAFGKIKHLKTEIDFESNSLVDIAEDLHPTPAVCGLPRNESKSLILELEPHSRELYTGYIGLEHEDEKRYFVNLRCGKLFKNGILMFVGGGLTADSIAENEWQETERKAESFKGL